MNTFVTVYKRSQYWHFGIKRYRQKKRDLYFVFDGMFLSLLLSLGGGLFLLSFSLYISFACLVPAL